MVGEKIGEYIVIKKLGKGSFGKAVLAYSEVEKVLIN